MPRAEYKHHKLLEKIEKPNLIILLGSARAQNLAMTRENHRDYETEKNSLTWVDFEKWDPIYSSEDHYSLSSATLSPFGFSSCHHPIHDG